MVKIIIERVNLQLIINNLTMQIQKAIEIFLQKNNLSKTLHIFKNQSKKTTTHYGQSKTSQLSNIHKFTLNNANANQVKQHFQKADPVFLKKAVRRLKRKNKIVSSKAQVSDITKLRFFRRLVQKQNNNTSNELQDSMVLDVKQSRSYVNPFEQSRQYDNEWDGQNDLGYEMYECSSSQLSHYSEQIVLHKNLEDKTVKPVGFPQDYYEKHNQKITKMSENVKDKKKTRLPPRTMFKHEQNEEIYPIEYDGITYDSYDLKIIYDREKTGFEQQRELPIVINQVLAARYQVVAVLGQAQFSKAIQVVDLQNNKNYCIKIIQNSKQENSKDYFDQSIDEIKLLRFVSANCNTDQSHLLTLHDFFYHKEHLMLVTELLKDNLYDAYKMRPKQFDLRSIQIFSRQILKALDKLHSLHIIHTDLKPQNILIKSYSKQELKVIDLGSSIFFHDRLSFYIQTRSYRSPEVILGCPYDEKIDIWSFGCIIAQIFTGQVLFDSQTVGGLLSKMQGLRGPWPSWMVQQGKYAKKYFTKQIIPYEEVEQQYKVRQIEPSKSGNQIYRLYVPKLTNLKSRLNCEDKLFIDFMSKCLKLDPSQRFSAKEALKHPFLTQ